MLIIYNPALHQQIASCTNRRLLLMVVEEKIGPPQNKAVLSISHRVVYKMLPAFSDYM